MTGLLQLITCIVMMQRVKADRLSASVGRVWVRVLRVLVHCARERMERRSCFECLKHFDLVWMDIDLSRRVEEAC